MQDGDKYYSVNFREFFRKLSMQGEVFSVGEKQFDCV